AHREPVMCTSLGYGRTARVVLRRPLGDRRLVDAANGHQVPAFDGSTLLEPTWLPGGWSAIGESGSGLGRSEPSWTRAFGAESKPRDQCSSPASAVRVIQGTPPAVEQVFRQDQFPTVSTLDVRGHVAEFGVDPGNQGTVLRWNEADQLVVLDGGSGCGGVPGLDLETLTQIAR